MTVQPNVGALSAYLPVASDKRLFPLCHYEALSAKNKPLGKTPSVKDWTKEEFGHEAMVAHMQDGKNVGFKVGNGFAVIDYDPRRDQAGDALTRLCSDFRIDLATCSVVDTGGDGVHVYLRIPRDFRGREQVPEYNGIELKHSQRRYVVAAGSLHPGDEGRSIPPGRPYTMRAGSPPLDQTSEAPAALLKAFNHLEPLPNERGNGPNSFGNFTAEQLAATLAHIPPEAFRSGSDPDWLSFMMACHWATGGEGREEFIAWSISDAQYSGHDETIRKRWDSLSPCATGIKTGLIFKTLERHNVPREHWPTEIASRAFDGEDLVTDALEDVAKPLPPGIEQFGKAKSYSFDALGSMIGDLPPFIDGFFYGNHGGIYVVYGEPKSGKSLLVYSLALAVANGEREWMGRRLWMHGPVRWFALESPHSLVMSGKAWMNRTGQRHPDIRFSQDGQVFSDPKWMEELEALCRGCRLAVVDTFTMAIPGQDQNSPEAASMLFSKLNEVGRRTGTTFIVIHHSTKADPRNARGSNAIIGNSDGSVAVLKEGEGEIRVEAMAVRYGPDGGELGIQIEQVILGSDPQRDGQTISGPFLTMIEQPEDDALASPLDEVAQFVVTHGKQNGDAFVLSRKIIRAHDLEPRSIRAIFERWEQTFTGQGYTLDLERVEGSKAQAIVVRCGTGSPLRGQRASVMFGDDPLSAEEVSAHAGLF